MKNQTSKGIILVMSTAVISGFAIFVNKLGVGEFNPYLFAFLKNFFVAFLLVGLLLGLKEFTNIKKLTKKNWLILTIIGLIGGSAPFLLFFKGLSLTTAANGAFIHKTMFIYVAVLATVFLKEKISNLFLIASIFLLMGNFYFLKFLPYGAREGDILIIAATILWAIENTISKYALKSLSPRIVAFGRMGIGSIFILLFLIFTGNIQTIGKLTTLHIQWILISGALLFGYVATWYTGLKYVNVSTATTVLLLGSPITSLLTFIFQGQPFSQTQLIGSVLLAFGVTLAIGFGTLWGAVNTCYKTFVIASSTK